MGYGRDTGAVDIAAPAEIITNRGRLPALLPESLSLPLLPTRAYVRNTRHTHRIRAAWALQSHCSHQLHNGSGSHRDRRRGGAGPVLGRAPRGAGTDLVGSCGRVPGHRQANRTQPARRHRALPSPARLSSRLGWRRGGRARGCLFDVVRSDDRHAPGTAAAEHFGFDGAEAWATARRQGHASRCV